jgi:hypothetical protein
MLNLVTDNGASWKALAGFETAGFEKPTSLKVLSKVFYSHPIGEKENSDKKKKQKKSMTWKKTKIQKLHRFIMHCTFVL